LPVYLDIFSFSKKKILVTIHKKIKNFQCVLKEK